MRPGEVDSPTAPQGVAPAAGGRGPKPAALAFIFITVLIDILSFGLIIPVLPHLVKQFVGGGVSDAAWWVGVFGTLFALIQFVSAPIQGTLSDRFGRRPVILVSSVGLGLDFIFMALAPGLMWLLVGRVISAITSASFTTANAYLADVTPPEKRAQSFGLLGAAFGVGFIIGPVLGGWLGAIDLRLPFWFAAGLALVNFCYGWFVLPESLAPERRSKRFEWKHANPIGSLGLLRRYPQVLPLAVLIFLFNLAHYVYPSVFVLYADYRYYWGPQTVGWVLALVGIFSVIVQVGLIKPVVKALGEKRTVIAGALFGMIGFAWYGFAPTGLLFVIGIPVMALWGLASPATQALITRQVGPEVQGRIQGALMSLTSLAGIAGPALFASTFAWFVGENAPLPLPGAPFLVASALLLIALVVALASQRDLAARAIAQASP